MKALTICQPYAHLICLPDDDDRAKRVENRTWGTTYRGPLLIHAGKSRKFLEFDDDLHDVDYGFPIDKLTFGAIVAVAELADCVALEMRPGWTSGRLPVDAIRRRPWLAGHQHVEGPFCFVLTQVRKFHAAIPYRGAQGFFQVPDEVVADEMLANA